MCVYIQVAMLAPREGQLPPADAKEVGGGEKG